MEDYSTVIWVVAIFGNDLLNTVGIICHSRFRLMLADPLYMEMTA